MTDADNGPDMPERMARLDALIREMPEGEVRALLDVNALRAGYVRPNEAETLRARLAEAMRERDEARTALNACIRAHETGRFEPAQAAYEAARALLDGGA